MIIRKMNKLMNLCHKIGIFAIIYQLSRNRCIWEYSSEKRSEKNNFHRRRQCQNEVPFRKVANLWRPLSTDWRVIPIVILLHSRPFTIAVLFFVRSGARSAGSKEWNTLLFVPLCKQPCIVKIDFQLIKGYIFHCLCHQEASTLASGLNFRYF